LNVKEKNQKFFTQKLQKPTIEQERIQTKKKENTVELYVSLSPYKQEKKLYKIITIPSVKKVIEKDLKLTISEKKFKKH